MSLRRPFAAVLQFLRSSQGLTQHEIAGAVAQSHISNLESLKTTPTVDTMIELAAALNVSAAAFFTMVVAAEQQRSPREVLLSAVADLERLGLSDELMPQVPAKLEGPRVITARDKKQLIQKLKKDGASRKQVASQLGYSKATVARLWADEKTE